jgi:N-acyl homoserine lactone hydrolase
LDSVLELRVIVIHIWMAQDLPMNRLTSSLRFLTFAALLYTPLVPACHRSSQATVPALLGEPRSSQQLLAVLSQPGPIELETVASATWQVDRSGLINLDHPDAHELESGPEPIEIYFHALRHPTKGLFIVDTGVERRYRDALDETPTSWVVRAAMDTSTLDVRMPLGDYLEKQPSKLRGVLMTHLHLDHVMGLPDVDDSVPIYVGPGEAVESHWMNLLTRSSIDGHLEHKHALRELSFSVEPAAPLSAVLDLFGDGSLWAIWVPGHTSGSVAYLARTPQGPVLMTGDACHTRWGWEHTVEPGDFSTDQAQSAVSLKQLKAFVAQHPDIKVRLGHQGSNVPSHRKSAGLVK